MLRISWVNRIINEEVLERISEEKLIWKSIVRRRNEWIGHIMRRCTMNTRLTKIAYLVPIAVFIFTKNNFINWIK